jgi:hypothetical protein
MLSRILMSSALIAMGLGFSGCGDSDDGMMEDVMPKYELSITNLTAGQPMAPAIATLHSSDYTLFSLGESASVALETLAEGGDNSVLLAEALATTNVDDAASFGALLTPGSTLSVTLEGDDDYLSLAGMLVNTNDGFVGLRSYHISHLEAGEVETLELVTYDAGTEANSESAVTVPAQGGEGFNADRDDTNAMVRLHAGVVTQDDALSGSALTSINKFDNPTAKLVIKRVQ